MCCFFFKGGRWRISLWISICFVQLMESHGFGSRALPRSGPASKVRQICFCNTHTLVYIHVLYNLEPQIKVMEHWCCTPCSFLLTQLYPICTASHFRVSNISICRRCRWCRWCRQRTVGWTQWFGEGTQVSCGNLTWEAHWWLMCFWEDEFDALKIIKGDFSKWGIPF